MHGRYPCSDLTVIANLEDSLTWKRILVHIGDNHRVLKDYLVTGKDFPRLCSGIPANHSQ